MPTRMGMRQAWALRTHCERRQLDREQNVERDDAEGNGAGPVTRRHRHEQFCDPELDEGVEGEADEVHSDQRDGKSGNEPMHVANGVDTAMFSPVDVMTRQRIRASLGVVAHDRVVLYVGRFVDKKGLPLLGRLARALPEYRWWFAGWGEAGSASHPATWQLPHVRMFGDRSGATLAELYVAADLLVLASLSEGFPLVVQEALACGTPALVAERIVDGAPAAREHLRTASIDGDDARVVENWTTNIARTLDENRDCARSDALAQFARDEWSWPATVARYESIFRGVVR